MKKHRNRHTNFVPMGNETATPVTANTPTATQQQSIIANSTTTQNDDPELSLFLCSKLPRKNASEQLITTILNQVQVSL